MNLIEANSDEFIMNELIRTVIELDAVHKGLNGRFLTADHYRLFANYQNVINALVKIIKDKNLLH